MPSGNDMRIGFAKETVAYGTRAAPTRFFAINGEDISYDFNRYYTPALGGGRWNRPSITTTSAGGGNINGDVPTTGFGYLIDALHNNVTTPVQQAATTAYLQTHTLDTASGKSYTVQIQTPPITSATLLPVDLYGVMFSGMTFSWDPGGVLRYEIPTIAREMNTAQTLATYVAPTSWLPLSFAGGSLKIGGVSQTDIVGAGNLAIGFNLRDDAFALGTTGLMAKPVETDKPTGAGSFTADFQDLAHLNRTVNNTIADVNLRFEGAIIASTFKYYLDVTIPSCVFTNPRPTVNDPGPVQQTVNFSNASSTNQPIVILYESTDVTI